MTAIPMTVSHEVLAEKLERLEGLSLARDEQIAKIETKIDCVTDAVHQMKDIVQAMAAIRTGGRFMIWLGKVFVGVGAVYIAMKTGVATLIAP